MTDAINLPFADGSSLRVTLRGDKAWPNHVHVLLRSAENVDLGNLTTTAYQDNLRQWVTRDSPSDATVKLNDVAATWVANLSPHKYVLYGTAGPLPLQFFVVDALVAPPVVVGQLELDQQCVDAWLVRIGNG